MDGKKLKIMVSSTVFGVEELLDRVYTLLTHFGYEVWMSHKGTVPVFSEESAFESCLMAVEKCDLFLGIITPQYGSGVDTTGISITHKEIKRAVELKKPRWFLAHDHVVFARRLMADLGYRKQVERQTLKLKPKSASITDLKVIDMYEDATMEHLPLDDRQGNWVQKYERDDDANLFVVAQFSRYQDVEQRLLDHLGNSKNVAQRLRGQDE
ncbi:DUF4062 domain-containing protein [Pseudomonas cichorii]|uniref:DUF4062 domain-containing protein n=1 Tax=Pseudomonas cichorii TaxID=36746 RepID=UPI001C89E029|nr:DUF4062 domain-containing protein [Pseudomonas cichorii]MBX8487709.1 DUF4062 domain-containing protein [Pseudomonas cichorii]MBX8495216.1 DUF4062 domain-containing protein [Pseudomonas cichorii]MBX8582354.1 DUF4062 domain-containing protein [Pseudomonas cichorii]